MRRPLRTRADVVRFLIERFRHRRLPVHQHVQVIRRLVRHARLAPNGCIEWPGARNNSGYGKFTVRMFGQFFQFYVHQQSHFLSRDPSDLPKWMHVSHSCDNAGCFHPDHVSRQRRLDNLRRSAERTNAKKRGEIPRERELRAAA